MIERRLTWTDYSWRLVRFILWAFGILICYLFIASFVHVFQSARIAAEWSSRSLRLRAIGLAMTAYEDKHNGRLPERGHWASSLRPFLADSKSLEGCEDVPANPPRKCGLIFREGLSGKKNPSFKDINDWVVIEDPSVLPGRRYRLELDGRVSSYFIGKPDPEQDQ